MNFWDVLCINPTDDVSVIKKAYAKKLKEHHPEDDPKGYQTVREAYNKALAYSKNFKESQERNYDTNQFDDINIDEPLNIVNKPPDIDLINNDTNSAPNQETVVNDFFEAVQNLYNDFFARIDIENWRSLLNSEVVWYIGSRELVRDRMMNFLMSNPYFPKAIWQLFNTTFGWTEDEEFFYERYPEKFMQYIFSQVNMTDEISYNNFKNIPGIDYDAYAAYREDAFFSLAALDLENAWSNILKAHEIYSDDLFLLRLEGEYYLLSKDFNSALDIFNQLLSLTPNDPAVLCDVGKCYLEISDLTTSKNFFLRVLQIDPSHESTKLGLKETRNKLQLKINAKPWNKSLKQDLLQVEKALGIYMPRRVIIKKRFKLVRGVFFGKPSLIMFTFELLLVLLLLKDMGWPPSIEKVSNFLNDKPIKTVVIKNPEDFYKVEPNKNRVEVTFSSAQFLDIYKVYKDNKTIYVSGNEIGKQHLNHLLVGYNYISIAKLGDKKIILVTNYDQATQIHKTGSITFKGTVYDDISTDLLEAIINAHSNYSLIDNRIDNIISARYLSVEESNENTNNWKTISLSILILIHFLILTGLLYNVCKIPLEDLPE